MDVAIIMPVWGQGPLLCEAVTSALNQKTEAEVVIILMDDTCEHPQTTEVCRRFARAHPDRVIYWRSPENRGLAAMRNEGVNLALRLYPDLYSVLFFDGDDRMHPSLVERSLTALRAAVEKTNDAAPGKAGRVGWVFEDPDHFGRDGLVLRTHRYSALWSMAGCAQTSSSMARAELFRSGLRYAETMKAGSEDWQFWLTCLSQGWRGVFVPHLGFRYRQRPGGMSVGALQLADSNKTSIRLSRKDLYHPDFFLKHEALEMPRYIVVNPDGRCEVRAHAQARGTPIELSSYLDQLAEYARLPTHAIPQFLIFANDAACDHLRKRKLLDWAFWRAEILARRDLAGTIGISGPVDEDGNEQVPIPALRCMSSAVFLDWCRSRIALPKLEAVLAETPDLTPGPPDAPIGTSTSFRSFLLKCRHKFEGRDLAPRQDMTTWRPFGLYYHQLCEAFFATPALLTGPDLGRDCAILAETATLEQPHCAANLADLAHRLTQLTGRQPSLVCLGDIPEGSDVGAWFRRLLLLREKPGTDRWQAELSGLLAPFGTLINLGSYDAVPVLNQIRTYGRRVIGIPAGSPETPTPLDAHMLTCFKIFDAFIAPDDAARAKALGQGLAEEQICDSLEQAFGAGVPDRAAA